jgi:two-component system chemotaxis response regulator CheY
LVCALLAEAGYHVRQAPNGQEALAVVAQVRPALVITDVQMPEVDGPTFMRHYRSRAATLPPVIALSASADGLAEAEAAGADVVLPKPFDLEDFLELVEWLVPCWLATTGQRNAALRMHARALVAECQASSHEATVLRAWSHDALAALEASVATQRARLQFPPPRRPHAVEALPCRVLRERAPPRALCPAA